MGDGAKAVAETALGQGFVLLLMLSDLLSLKRTH